MFYKSLNNSNYKKDRMAIGKNLTTVHVYIII